MKRHQDHGDSYKGKHVIGVVTVSVVWSIIIMVGHGSMDTDRVLEKELHLDPKAAGSTQRHPLWIKHI